MDSCGAALKDLFDAAGVEQDRIRWRHASRSLAKRKCRVAVPDAECAPVKKRRVKTFLTMMHVDNMIKVAIVSTYFFHHGVVG